jgi:FkbM family methyltransferase
MGHDQEFSPDGFPGPDRLVLVDVGGAGGVQPKWLPFADRLFPVLFEPNPAEAAKLRATLAATFPQSLILETGLAETTGPQTLNLTRHFGCTSLLKPNQEFLAKYRIARHFRVTGTLEVACTRFDELHGQGAVPAPDAIKVDVQGYEYQVLRGFGDLLHHCIGIELETHVYPIYHGQKLLHEIIDFLAGFGFSLRRMHPKGNFDGDVVEIDVFFTKGMHAWADFTPAQRAKFEVICKAWNLVDYATTTAARA